MSPHPKYTVLIISKESAFLELETGLMADKYFSLSGSSMLNRKLPETYNFIMV